MASFVIHNIVGERLLKLLEEKYNVKFNLQQRTEFLLSNLIADSSKIKFCEQDNITLEESKKIYQKLIQEEKILTHFRNDDDIDLHIQVPNLQKFEDKYGYLFGIFKKIILQGVRKTI